MYTPKAGAESGLFKTSLGQFHECARAVRQSKAVRRQSVLFLAAHLAECKLETIRQEHRIITEALVPARGVDQGAVDTGFELLQMAIRPGDTQSRDEVRAALIRLGCTELAQQQID